MQPQLIGSWLLCVALGATTAQPDRAGLEQALVEELKTYSSLLEDSLANIQEYVHQVNQVYAAECRHGVCTEKMIREKILGNPVYNYQLLKRLLVYFKRVENAIEKADSREVLERIGQIKSRHGGLPSEADLQGVGRTIIRLLDTYELDIDNLITTQPGGAKFGSKLDAGDSLYLGELASASRKSEVSVILLERAVLQAMREANQTQTALPASEVARLEQKLGQERLRLRISKRQDTPITHILGQVPPKTLDPNKMVTAVDNANYKALCQGQNLLPQSVSKSLVCYYSRVAHPYYTLHPVAVEEVHPQPHPVLVFHHILSSDEADLLAFIAEPRMKSAVVGRNKMRTDDRVSRNVWLEDKIHPLVDRLSERINMVTGLETSQLFDRRGGGERREEFELLQVASYTVGGHYYLHHDPMHIYKGPDFLAKSAETRDNEHYITGDRMSTIMFYLSHVQEGGITAFPRLGIGTRPVKGSAVFWHNIHRSGHSDMHMLHAACPVLAGKKIVANKWVREVANIFTRPCGLAPDIS